MAVARKIADAAEIIVCLKKSELNLEVKEKT